MCSYYNFCLQNLDHWSFGTCVISCGISLSVHSKLLTILLILTQVVSSLQYPTNGFMNEDKSLGDRAASTSETCSDSVALSGGYVMFQGRDLVRVCVVDMYCNPASVCQLLS